VRLRRTSLALLAAALAASTLAHDAPQLLAGSFQARSGRLVASLDLAPAFRTDLKKQLSNGLRNVIALNVALLPEDGQDALALYVREIDVLYDVWDGSYGVTIKDSTNPRGRTHTFQRFEELQAFLTEARAVDLVPLSELGARRWILQTRVELNPISKELLERTREFIANPTAGGRSGIPSRSILGAMASYLLKSADSGANVGVFRTRPFTASELSRP